MVSADAPTTAIVEWEAVYADFEPLPYLLPAGWGQQGKYIRHVLKVGFSGIVFRWQVSDDGDRWRDWLAT